MSFDSAVASGKRSLAVLIDERAKQKHARPYASIPLSNDVDAGYVDISYTRFANAINRCAQSLLADLGPSTSFEPIIYIGPSDFRYQILAIAASKAGYSICFPSTRNTTEAQLALIQESKAKAIASPQQAHPLVARTIKETKLKQVTIPELDVLLDETEAKLVPFEHAFESIEKAPWVLLQSFNSSGSPTTTTLSHGFAVALGSWSASQNNDVAKRFSEKKVFCSLPGFHITNLIQSQLTVWHDSTLVLPPPFPLTADQVNNIHSITEVSSSILTPSLVTELTASSAYKSNLLKLESITYASANLSKNAGDALASSISLAASLASPQLGPIATLPSTSSDWDFIRFDLESDSMELRKTDIDDDSFELVLIKDAKIAQLHPVFANSPDLKEYPTKFLFSAHPVNPDLWKYKGRSDGAIMLGDGDEVSPESLEETIAASSGVKACVVVGDGRPRPCLLVEPESHSVEEKHNELEQQIWPDIEKANKGHPRGAQIQRGLILFTYPDIPLPRDANGNVKRSEAFKLYHPDINALYRKWEDSLTKDVVDLDFDNINSTTLSLQYLLRKKFDLFNIETNEDFFQRGLDSVDIVALARLINANSPPNEVKVKDIYENPTARELATHIQGTDSTRNSSSNTDPKTLYTMQHVVDASDKELPPPPPPKTAMDHIKKFLNKKDNYAEEPPNGGIVAWLQVLGCFLVFMNNWGLASSFGVYQAYYQLPTSSPSLSAQGKTASQISWIGTIQASFTLIFGVLSGPLFDKGYFFQTLVVASVLMCFSFMMLSLCDQYWQVILTQGILQGICSGLLYIPSVSQIPQYFTTKRGVALGLVTAGAPFGGIIYPIIFRELITRYDFEWATRAIGFVAFALLLIACIIIKPLNLKNKIEKKLVDPTMFKDPPYVSFLAGSFFLFCGMLTPYVLCATYSVTVVDGYDRTDFVRLSAASASGSLSPADAARFLKTQDTAFYTVAIINAGNFFGRIIPCAISDLGVGPEYMLFACDLALSILGFVWITVKQRANYNAFLVLYGFFSGGIASLPAAALPYICPSLEVFATRLGLVYFFAGIGVLIGTPIATAIDASTADPDDYLGSQLWVGITMACGLFCVVHSGYFGGKRRRVIQKAQKEERRRKIEEKSRGELKA
ncbi:MFS transporter-like protein 16 [Elsinoe australis]|uniref:MFS transporter-like protein 16 n=1 Tax=Elsinoe australis TaxID=40998 RepID=A0A4V6YAY5_9PEZI|nr:MFS transporter-like protein 16 [Elsinoe australis]